MSFLNFVAKTSIALGVAGTILNASMYNGMFLIFLFLIADS